jgi:hypothetical protein
MALAVASTSEAFDNPFDGTVVVTKPVGVTAGDLLVIVAASPEDNPAVTCSGFTASFQFGHNNVSSGEVGYSFLYRFADASDVSASNYSVTGSSVFAVYMLRITGYTSGNPVFTNSLIETGLSTSSATTLSSGTIDLTVPTEQILIMGMACGDDDWTDYSSASVTPSNPSWTFFTERDTENGGGTLRYSCRVAYATRSQVTNITNFSYTADQRTSGSNTQIGFLACICTPQNATASNSLITNQVDVFSTLTGSTQTPNTDFKQTTPEFPTQQATAKSPNWTDVIKTDGVWTNQTK